MAYRRPHGLLILIIIFFIPLSFHLSKAQYIAYNTTAGIVAGKLNVHLVPHTHDDVGWLKTVDQYYVGSNNSIQGASVQNVLDSLVFSLLQDKNRRFIYVEQAFFQRWWRRQSDAVKEIVRGLISSGQLELINGGMCMHDEATAHYIDMIDQTTLGHRFIKQEFGQIPRIGWQIDPFGHSAVQAYLLSAEVGFDAVYFSRIDYQDRDERKNLKSLEVVWRGSKTFSSSTDVFTGIFPVNYEPPPGGFYFEVNDDSPVIQDDPLLFDYNVEERVNDFVSAAISQANITRTNHIMFTMGTDFKYQYANSWFKEMDKFIHYVNQIQGKFYLRIDPLGEGAKWRRRTGQEIYSPLLLAFSEQDGDNWANSHVTKFSATESYSLPENVAIITLQALNDGSALLRLAHLYELGEDKDLSKMATVDLKKLFPGKMISKITETNLSANQERSEMEKKRLKWKVEGTSKSDPLVRGKPVDPSELLVELGPMEIRTFVLNFLVSPPPSVRLS